MTLPANEVRSRVLGVRLSPDELADLDAAAEKLGLNTSAFVRMLIVSTIKRERSK